MKIAWITHAVDNGGAARSLFFLSRALPTDWNIRVFSSIEPSGSFLHGTGLPIEHFDIPTIPIHLVGIPNRHRTWKQWARKLHHLPNLVSRIRAFRPDIILLNGYLNFWIAPVLGLCLPRSRIALFAREMLELTPRQQHLVSHVLKYHVHHIVAISHNEQKQLTDMGMNHVSVLYNSNCQPVLDTPRPRPLSSTVRFGVLGAVRPSKGQQLVLDACSQYQREFTEAGVRFVIQGNTESLEPDVSKGNLGALIELRPWSHDVSATLDTVDVLLRPDMTGSPWGRDILEAMSVGLPVIASGSCDEFVKPGQTGDLFPVGDVNAMSKLILSLAADESKRREYGLNALAFARKHFDPAKNARTFMSMVESWRAR